MKRDEAVAAVLGAQSVLETLQHSSANKTYRVIDHLEILIDFISDDLPRVIGYLREAARYIEDGEAVQS